MRPILANHDRSAVEIFCYTDVLSPDNMTQELRTHSEHWRVILGLPDEAAADRIRADHLDVLVDLTMHMARNRLLVFARKPAPVQVCYLAYCSTTGLDAMDFRLTDRWLDPLLEPITVAAKPAPPFHMAEHVTVTATPASPVRVPGHNTVAAAPASPLRVPEKTTEAASPSRVPEEIPVAATPASPSHVPKSITVTATPPSPVRESPAEEATQASRLPSYSERSVYLPDTYWCYEAPADAPEVFPSPAVVKGFLTFGCLNNFCKVSPAALAAWAEILSAVPESRLILHAKEGSHRERVRQRLIELGVDLAVTSAPGGPPHDRLLFVPMLPMRDYLRIYGQIDLALDPFPYGGGTTTLDGLWMGVPAVTLAGETAVGRGGVSIFSNLGLTDFIARSKAEYVATAVALSRDFAPLGALRMTLRERMLRSPLMDAPRFTRNLERRFLEMAELKRSGHDNEKL